MLTGRRTTAIMVVVSIALHAAAIVWFSVAEPVAGEPEELGILISMAAPIQPEPEPDEPEPVVTAEATTPVASEPDVKPAVATPAADAIPLLDDIEPRIAAQQFEDATLVDEVISAPVADPAIAVTYEDQMSAWLARQKRYPKLALRRGIEGECAVRIIIDRAGRVQVSVLASSSRNNLLDREALAMVDRANPFPVPPDEVPGATLEYVIPVRFDLQ